MGSFRGRRCGSLGSAVRRKSPMRRSVSLLIKPRSNVNENQAAKRAAKDLAAIRERHAQRLKEKDDAPFGKADRHVIAAWMEIEDEDRAELLGKGTPPHVVDKTMLKNRLAWVAETTAAWEENAIKIGPVTSND